jgi:hypothetical protein
MPWVDDSPRPHDFALLVAAATARCQRYARQKDAAGFDVGHIDAGTGGECAGKLASHWVPVVRRAEGVDQPVNPGLR